MIKVVLADDHQMFIDGMKVFLEGHDHIQVVGEANSGIEVLDILEKQEVDVVVLDIEMPELDGIETTKFIRKKYEKTNHANQSVES